MKKSFFLIVLIAFSGADLLAQAITPTGAFALNVDYARFRNNDQTGYLEVYYGFYPSLLTYQLSEGKYKAGVQLWTSLKEHKTQTLTLNERALLPVAITDTSEASFKYPFVSQSGYAVPFGNYTLEVVAIDSLNPSRRDSISLDIHIDAYPDGVSCSDLELCGSIKSSKQRTNPFFKNSLEVVPNPILVFGVTAYPVIFNYLELYNLDPEETYTVNIFIIDSNENIVRESSKKREYNVSNTVEVGTIPLTSFLSGKYRFEIVLLDEDSREISRSEKAFYIYNPHIKAPTEPVISFQASELDGLSEKDLEKEFDQAKYIATDEDITMFKQLDTETGKREFLVNFWTNIERGRLDRSPIKRSDYLKLVEIADEKYHEMGKEGWRTHRGRVFILHGEPDDIERYPSMGESKPYEIWRYHKIEAGVEFVFVDRLGYGYYELVHSTKRGEFRDENWERYLR